ncbi:phage major tail protein, TP901-1 family [uncultured Thomasclavelia sp.]|uniref:phage major tail protein, TP901-1 family n=1 Tax=uncultured Thomasclavelia sp. TaxID=3025759 RepID=UPI00260F318D|nr:phage major tail protein, TP901-1 family [uncultured Thomasclavelia sp.]
MERRFNLQLFAEAVQGKRIVYLYRIFSKASTTAATNIAFTTENENTMSQDADVTQTKDGAIRTPGGIEVEITCTSIMAKGDTLYDDLKGAMRNSELVEMWEVNLDEKGTDTNADKYKATYYQGYLTEVGLSASAEDFAEISITYGANGSGASGYATLTTEQQELAEYVFKDTTKVSE